MLGGYNLRLHIRFEGKHLLLHLRIAGATHHHEFSTVFLGDKIFGIFLHQVFKIRRRRLGQHLGGQRQFGGAFIGIESPTGYVAQRQENVRHFGGLWHTPIIRVVIVKFENLPLSRSNQRVQLPLGHCLCQGLFAKGSLELKLR